MSDNNNMTLLHYFTFGMSVKYLKQSKKQEKNTYDNVKFRVFI